MAGEARDARDDDEGTDIPLDDEPDDDGAGDSEPQTLEEWKAAAEKARQDLRDKDLALRKANRERARLGRRTADQPKPAAKKAVDKPDAPDVSPDTLRQLEEATTETKKWRSRTIKEKSKLALAAAGVDPKRVERIVRLIEEEDLDVDEDDNLVGIDDQIEDLKAEWPEFFGYKPPKQEEPEEEPKPRRPVRDRRANRDAGDKAAAGSPQESIAEQRYKTLFGDRRRSQV